MNLNRAIAGAAASALVALTLGACATSDDSSDDGTQNADTVKITHAQGTTEVAVNPKSVITFDIASLDTLDALGIDTVTGVPKESVPEYLKQYAGDEVVNIGTLFEPDFEAIPLAKPDLIIVAGRSAPAYKELAKDFTVIDLTIDQTDYMRSLRERTETLGKIFDKEKDVEAALDELEKRAAAVKASAENKGTGLVILTSAGELTAYGTGSRYGMIHKEFGVKPAVEEIKSEGPHGESVSFEFIKKANPDWLFVIDRDAAVGEAGKSAKEVLDNPLVAGTKAWSKDQVVYLDPLDWYIVGGGLEATSKMISQLEDAFGV